MTSPIEFWFEFSSPYGYFASLRIDGIAEAAGRACVWRPFMLGPVFKLTGGAPLSTVPVKGAYSVHDWERMARMMDVPYALPDPFPILTLAAARAFYWIDEGDSDAAKGFARAAYHAYFGEGRNISDRGVLAAVAEAAGIDAGEMEAAITRPEVKERLRAVGDEAIEKGVCGSPFFIVDGEGFWGSDRLWMVRKWLEAGGW